MAIERARTHTLSKPWGSEDLRPWRNERHDGNAIGEIWYERPGHVATEPSLLLKLLFTTEPLSIQVHPDDTYAQSIGLRNGKTEAWYVLSAAPQAKLALGLKQRQTQRRLRQAIDDGSIADLVAWRAAAAGDAIFVPAGTIHALGAGLVIAEIQQRSDATFRLFDHGRGRELHIESAIAVVHAGPAQFRVIPEPLSEARTLLVSNAHFMFEKIDLPPNSAWCLEAEQETWLLVVDGSARAGSIDVAVGDAIFAQEDRVEINAGAAGMAGLVAYTRSGPVPGLLRRLGQPDAADAKRPQEAQVRTSFKSSTRARPAPTNRRMDLPR